MWRQSARCRIGEGQTPLPSSRGAISSRPIRTRARHRAQTRRRPLRSAPAVRFSVARTRSSPARSRGLSGGRAGEPRRGGPDAIRRPGVPAGRRQPEDPRAARRTADGGSPGPAPVAKRDLDDINSACPRALAPTRHASTPLARRPGPVSLARHPGRRSRANDRGSVAPRRHPPRGTRPRRQRGHLLSARPPSSGARGRARGALGNR